MENLKRLYKYFPKVKKYVVQNNGNSLDAEDIFQEGLFIYWKQSQKENFVLTSSQETYLFSICKNLWMQELRKKKQFPSSDLPEEVSQQNNEEYQQLHLKENLAHLAIQFLNEKCRDILGMFYYHKMSLQQIAKKFNMVSDVAAKNQKYQCLEKARNRYQELYEIKNA